MPRFVLKDAIIAAKVRAKENILIEKKETKAPEAVENHVGHLSLCGGVSRGG